jgi:hypothetical protein
MGMLGRYLKQVVDPNRGDVNRLVRAFPSTLSEEVGVVASALPFASNPIRLPDDNLHYVDKFVTAWRPQLLSLGLQNESIELPYRVYLDEPEDQDIKHLTDVQRVILHCIYTRHHDGHVRQKHLEGLRGCDDVFIVPFCVQLLGEYVIEILETLEKVFEGTLLERCSDFLLANPIYWEQTQSRMASYWGAYYRYKYPYLRDYIGKRLVDRLNDTIRSRSIHIGNRSNAGRE